MSILLSACSAIKAFAGEPNLTEKFTNTIGMTLVRIPAGEFQMGSTDNKRKVKITKEFFLGSTEVTQEQWKRVMSTVPWQGQSEVREGSDYPATYVSWDDATAFCKKLTEIERDAGMATGMSYALPTKAQWEYACRAGTDAPYSFGNDYTKLDKYAWYEENADALGEKYAHRVAQKQGNPWSLYDMHGNVQEWCTDWYAFKSDSQEVDPQGPAAGSLRVFRGGSWRETVGNCGSAAGGGVLPGARSDDLGIRVIAIPSVK